MTAPLNVDPITVREQIAILKDVMASRKRYFDRLDQGHRINPVRVAMERQNLHATLQTLERLERLLGPQAVPAGDPALEQLNKSQEAVCPPSS